MAQAGGKYDWRIKAAHWLVLFALLPAVGIPVAQTQSSGNQTQAPAQSQPAQDIPDAPSTVQPPPPKATLPPPQLETKPQPPAPTAAPDAQQTPEEEKPSPTPMPPVEAVPAGSIPRNQLDSKEDLYKISVPVNFVLLPVMVKDPDGRRVDGLLWQDFTVLENGKKQTLTFFTSDPFQLSAAILIDIGLPDVAVQKVNQTYSALTGAFSPYDEVAVYTYSSTVSQVSDFTSNITRLAAVLNQLKLVSGRNNGPQAVNDPFSVGPSVNGVPVGGPPIAPVQTPPREAHVLNDAILRAALDLSKRERIRRKVIFVISDGRELGSTASYRDVLKLLETRDIQVRGVVVDSGALPIFRQVEKIRLKGQGYSNILPKYVYATCGGQVLSELSRNAIENAYVEITSEARNQYTLGYSPKSTTGSSAYRSIEVLVDKRDVKVLAKDGYYPAPRGR